MERNGKYIKLINIRNSIIYLSCALSFFLGGFITRQMEEDKITISVIKEAQKIIGIGFTNAEADSMIQTLETRRKNYAENDLHPPLKF
ncbi:MAG: hypothetical protein ACO1NS_01640 [Daejeonella sp.]